jgi:hypothetical protein
LLLQFEAVLMKHRLEDGLLAGLLHFPCHQQLVQDKVRLAEVEDEVEFADLRISILGTFPKYWSSAST